MTVHPDQAGPNWNYSHIACRDCIQLPLDVYGIDAIIDTKILENSHTTLAHLVDLDKGRNPNIVTLKKYRGEIFQNAALKDLRQFFYVMSTKSY